MQKCWKIGFMLKKIIETGRRKRKSWFLTCVCPINQQVCDTKNIMPIHAIELFDLPIHAQFKKFMIMHSETLYLEAKFDIKFFDHK